MTAQPPSPDEITDIPTTGLKAFIEDLARKHGVRYVRTSTDDLAEMMTRLSGDDVQSDEIEDLLVALKRAHVIDGRTMLHLNGNYIREKFGVKDGE